MTRYQELFHKLHAKKEIGFIPFVTLGDPSLEISLKIITLLINNGADALELGIPFSDPIADGNIIQNANLRSLSAKMTLKKCFQMLSMIRNNNPNIPIGLLTYANIVFNKGINQFYSNCFFSGVDSVLIADLPIEESLLFRTAAKDNKIHSVFICPPNANDTLIQKISLYSSGYTYLVSRAGVTGMKKNMIFPLNTLITKLKIFHAPPIIQGFGISNITQIKQSILSGVSGVICGSVIVKIIEQECDNLDNMFLKITNMVKHLKSATVYHVN